MKRDERAFTLIELAIAVLILALLISGLLYTLTGQTEQRNFQETRLRLERARQALLGFVAANGRLPCPARCSNWPTCDTGAYATADEVRDPTTGKVETTAQIQAAIGVGAKIEDLGAAC